MEDGKKRITVSIHGQSYTLVGDASSEYMRMLAGYVDEKMQRIAEGNDRLDSLKIAVLCAVNIADEYFRMKDKYEELEKRVKRDKRKR